MLGLKAVVNVIDNSGATLAEVINVYKVKTNPKKSVGFASVGDVVLLVIKRARPVAAATKVGGVSVAATAKLRRGDMQKGVIVRTKKEERRPDGTIIKFDDSAAVLLTAKLDMLGTRVTGPVSAGLRMIQGSGSQPGGKWAKILALAPKVV